VLLVVFAVNDQLGWRRGISAGYKPLAKLNEMASDLTTNVGPVDEDDRANRHDGQNEHCLHRTSELGKDGKAQERPQQPR
jgi:hypothetical protein